MKKILTLFILSLFISLDSFATLVTFQIDMNYVENVDSVFIAGSFQGWCANCTPMTDLNNDGIWEKTMDIPIGTHEYKFTQGTWGDAEALANAGACTIQYSGYGNRVITVSNATPCI